jgi:hypothetical protein
MANLRRPPNRRHEMTDTPPPVQQAARERLEVRYELTEQDAGAVFRLALGHPTIRRSLGIIAVTLLPLGMVACAAVGGVPLAGIALGAIGINCAIVAPWLVRLHARRTPAFRGPHTVSIAPGGGLGGGRKVSGRSGCSGRTCAKWQHPRAICCSVGGAAPRL